MDWVKKGHIYAPDGSHSWAVQRALPVTPLVRGETIRLYTAFCDADMVGRVGWVDVALEDPSRVIAVSQAPVLDVGMPGAFDDSGVLPTAVLPVRDKLYMYYVGYQRSTRVPYFQLQGLAISSDGGDSFQRWSRVPALERSDEELHHRSSAFVAQHNGGFRVWYVGGNEWIEVGPKLLPRYRLRYAESSDGMSWPARGQVCLDFANDDEHAFGRPWVVGNDGGYELFYSVRSRSKGYRLGYATSDDGITWDRRDAEMGLDVSPEGWDSETVEYPAVVDHDGTRYLFYCGNGCGSTGFGYAELQQ